MQVDNITIQVNTEDFIEFVKELVSMASMSYVEWIWNYTMEDNGVTIEVSEETQEYLDKPTYYASFEDFLNASYWFATKYIIQDGSRSSALLADAAKTILSQDYDMAMFDPGDSDMIVQQAVFGEQMFS